MVIWLLGISGSGKTTLGKRLKTYYDDHDIKSFLLDGDVIRDFFNHDLGYTSEDRKQNIKRILLSAFVLETNGVIPIICNISPFESLRLIARDKLKDYVQIYLHKDLQAAQKHDVKNVYKDNLNISPIVGLDLEFEPPQQNELILNVDEEDVEVSFEKIISYLNSKAKDNE